MNVLPVEKRVEIVKMLVEGMSIRAAARISGASINTIGKLLSDIGAACADYQDQAMRGLRLTNVQVDEIWAFVAMKAKNVPADADPTLGLGDCYCYTAIDRETKLMPCYMLGYRTYECALSFMLDLATRIDPNHRFQLTTDGMNGYPSAVQRAFGDRVDYAVLNKTYAAGPAQKEAKRRYSPSEFVSAEKVAKLGAPDMAMASTSHVERANLTMRMGMRRFTRLTKGFSKKIEQHFNAVSLHMLHYNFCRIHKTLRVTPAMAAGIADHVWSIEEVVSLIPKPVAKKRGQYKPRQPKGV